MEQTLSKPARWFFIGIVALTLGAGAMLLLFPHDTDVYFAWTIAEPMTAAFMGAAYLGGLANIWTLRRNTWSIARVAVPAIFVFATSMLVATLLDLSTFEWSRPVTWSWLTVYVVYPIAAPIVWFTHERTWSGPADSRRNLPRWFGAAMAVSAVLFAAVGLTLIVTPDAAADVWPWALTSLTGRVVGGWFLQFATLNAMLALQRSVRIASVALASSATVGAMLLVAAARLAVSLDGAVATIAFLAAAAFMLLAPAVVVAGAGRERRSVAGVGRS